MSGHDPLSKHERRLGYLKMAISLGLEPKDRDDCDHELHPRETTGVGVLVTLVQATEDFINDIGH